MIEKRIPDSVELRIRRALLNAYETDMPIAEALSVARKLYTDHRDEEAQTTPADRKP
jgi:hypothetical protein